jgi:hypothetical protein
VVAPPGFSVAVKKPIYLWFDPKRILLFDDKTGATLANGSFPGQTG